MTIKVCFFARLREQMGKTEVALRGDQAVTVAQAWALVANGPMPANVLAAVNFEYASPDQALSDGDEVAFFPPVTGG